MSAKANEVGAQLYCEWLLGGAGCGIPTTGFWRDGVEVWSRIEPLPQSFTIGCSASFNYGSPWCQPLKFVVLLQFISTRRRLFLSVLLRFSSFSDSLSMTLERPGPPWASLCPVHLFSLLLVHIPRGQVLYRPRWGLHLHVVPGRHRFQKLKAVETWHKDRSKHLPCRFLPTLPPLPPV